MIPDSEQGPDVDVVAPLTPNASLRYDLVQRMLPAGVTDVLEVGCGQGAAGARLAQRFRYLGVEPDRESWEVARRRIAAVGRGEVRNVTVDALGDERTAKAWLVKDKKIAAGLPVRDYSLHSRLDDLPFLHAAAVAALNAFGLDGLARQFAGLDGTGTLSRFNLDGLLALWQPPATDN